MKKLEFIFEFVHTDCVYESGWVTISVHRTKKGAYSAMNKFLNSRFNESRDETILYGKSKTFDHVFEHEGYGVQQTILNE